MDGVPFSEEARRAVELLSSGPNDKYLVVAKEDISAKLVYFRGNPNLCAGIKVLLEMELPDAEVIRHQDITAAPIFHHYASSVRTLMEMAEMFGIEVDRENLTRIADHFHEAAIVAEGAKHKVPD